MAAVGWVSFTGFLFCMISLGMGQLNTFSAWFLVGIAAACFIGFCWTVGAFKRDTWVETIDGNHPDALGSLDMKERGIQ